MQAPAHACQRGGDEGVGRRYGVPGQFHVPVAKAAHPARLQVVLGVEDQAGCLRQTARPDAVGKVTGQITRAGSRQVAHGTQWPAVEACRGPGRSGHRRENDTAAQPRGGVILVIHRQLDQYWSRGCESGHCGCEPSSQAVRVDCDRQCHAGEAFRRQRWQCALQFLFEQSHAIDVLAKAPAGVGGAAGLAAHDQGAAHPLL